MKRLIGSAICALTLTTGAGLAHADSKCNNFEIIVENEFTGVDGVPNQIKVFDLSYWDDEDGVWRGETTSNETINYGSSETWSKNLSFVGGEYGVVVRVHYRVFFNGAWGADRTKDSAAFRCIDNDSIRITID